MKIPLKRATVYLNPRLHQALKIKAAQTERTLSDLINTAIRHILAEDFEDLSAFEQRENEPNLDFQDVLKELKASGTI